MLCYAFCCPGMSTMPRRTGERSTGKSAQFAITAFDEWGTLPSFLEETDEARSGSDVLLKICRIAQRGKVRPRPEAQAARTGQSLHYQTQLL